MNEFLDKYEENLLQLLLREITSSGYSNGQLLSSVDLDEKWELIAPEYAGDAVPEIANYPLVSVGWAAFAGMGMAALWDNSWEEYSKREDIYSVLKGKEGFDFMDENILIGFFKLDPASDKYHNVETMVRMCAQRCVDAIRREQIEPQSLNAFYVFTRSVKVMYRIGISIAFSLLNYSYQKLDLDDYSSYYS